MNIILGILIGFIVSEIICGRTPGKTRFFRSLKFKSANKTIHIHHWAWCLILLVILFVIGCGSSFVSGLFLGALIQGITYKDSFRFIYK